MCRICRARLSADAIVSLYKYKSILSACITPIVAVYLIHTQIVAFSILCSLHTHTHLPFQTRPIDINKTDSLLHAQFTLEDTQEKALTMTILVHRHYAPDICAGRCMLSVAELLSTSGAHRGPVLRQVRRGNCLTGENTGCAHMLFKWVLMVFLMDT
jgi:hypothetical protein